MCLYSSCVSRDGDEDEENLFTIIEQINYGVPSLISEELQRMSVAELNYKAGLASMKRWDFGGSFRYMQAAQSLLSADSWNTHYGFALSLHYQLAKAAYPCGAIDIAKSALNEIDQRGKCLEDKLDAYDLLVRMLQHHQDDPSLAFHTCCKTLKLLGEDVPSDDGISRSAVMQLIGTFKYSITLTSQLKITSFTQLSFRSSIELARTRFNTSFISSSEMLSMPRTTCKQSSSAEIMRFYYHLALVSYTKGDIEDRRARGLLCSYYISRWVSYCLNQKVICRHTPVALGFCK
jgi:predicted ATPase